MSWQQYVDGSLVGSGHVTKAAIVGKDGSIWAKTEGWVIENDTVALAQTMAQDAEAVRSKGITLEGAKYFTIAFDDGNFYGKQGPNGLSLAMSDQAIVVGFHSENITPANCRMTVEGIKDYLKGVGY
jgi:profilin|uniref:Profilin n=1 Tax=Eutreptiella gymnastica TaxID=73025 RepID=A0A7S4GHG6_9EUGL|mmetsp:Transcript_56954/g.94499  ORF Transcript_56954/g.94499 Transcript_56954/m.94499 type:complete len:127 (-) Transcript_56954:843-1223(-)